MPRIALPEREPVQVLRGLAALAVAWLHIAQAAGSFVGRPGETPYVWMRVLPWEAGVDVFFVISGFVMVYASARSFGAWASVPGFLARRIARVVPLYWIMTASLLMTAVAWPGALSEPLGEGWRYIVASFLFIPWQRPDGFVQPVFRLGWTLEYEMLFYVIFAAFLPLARNRAVVGVVLTIVGIAGVGQLLHPRPAQLAFWSDPIVVEFAYGCLLGNLAVNGVSLNRSTRLVLTAAGLLALLLIGRDDTPTRCFSYGLPAACFVAAAAFGPASVGSSALARTALLLGDASYALYLVHPFPMRAFREAFARLAFVGPVGIVAYVLVSLAGACAGAVLLHVWLERPTTRASRRLLHV
jgi:exopolysaccharide production protein ExoZ